MDNLHKIQSIIDKWTQIADESDTRIIIDEMKALLNELIEAKIPKNEILKFKDRILRVWIQLTWADAREKHPDWSNKEWWKRRRDWVLKAFGDTIKSMSEEVKEEKSEKDYFSHMPLFTNVEDLMKWKARRSSNS